MAVFNLKPLELALPSRPPPPRSSLQRHAARRTHLRAAFVEFEGFHTHGSLLRTQTTVVRSEGVLHNAVSNGATVFAMRHRRKVKKLGRPADQRKALIRGLVTEILRHGKIRTTTPRAKAIRPFVDKMIGLAKRGTLHARRQALGFIYDKALVRSLFEKVPERYADRTSGFTRVKKEVKFRRGDGAQMSTIELV